MEKKKNKIVLVYTPHENWQTGASQTFMKVVRKINKESFNVTVFVQKEDPNVAEIESMEGVTLVRCLSPESLDVYGGKLGTKNPIIGFKRIKDFLLYLLRVKKIISSIEPNLIWVLNWRGIVSIGPVVKSLKVPLIYQVGLGITSKGKKTILNEVLLKFSTAVFIESEAQISNLYSNRQIFKYKNKFRVLPFGIDVEKFSANQNSIVEEYKFLKQDNNFVLGTVCQLHPRKGVNHLIDIVSELSNHKNKEVHLVVVGGDPSSNNEYLKVLKKQAITEGIEKRVHFVGWQEQDDVPKWLSVFDVFSLYTKGEGIPVSVRESMAMGVPVIATDVGGMSDIIVNDYNGKLIPYDKKGLFIDAVKNLVNNPTETERLGMNSIITVKEKFSLEKQIREYEKTFYEIIESN